MGKFTVLIFVLFIGAIAFLSVSNTGMITLDIPFLGIYEISKIGLILLSSASGALMMIFIFMVRDTRRMIEHYQYQRKQKREEKLQGLYSRALNAILAGKSTEAEGRLQDVLRSEPEHTDALLRLGDLSTTGEEFDGALRYYKRALQSAPKNMEAMFSLVAVSEKRDAPTEALNYLEDILDIDSVNLGALLRKRAVLDKLGRWDQLIDVQQAILKHRNASLIMADEEALLLGYRYEYADHNLVEGDIEKAAKGFKNIIRVDAGFAPAYLGVAETMLSGGDSEGAVSFLEKGYEQTASQIILGRMEDILIEMGEPSRLIRSYRKAVAAAPQDVMLKFMLGKLYYRLEMVDDALEVLGGDEGPEAFPEWNFLLGELYLRRSQYEQAVSEFRKTVDVKRTLRFPYCCTGCGDVTPDFSGRCPVCGQWNTYQFNLYGNCKI